MSIPDWTQPATAPVAIDDPMPSELFLLRRVSMLSNELARLQDLIATAVVRLHGDDDRIEVADFLERTAAPF